MSKKVILDACCGGRMFWFDKKHPHTLFTDIRKEDKGFIQARPNFEIRPDQIVDFRDMPFPDNSFKLVAWDPPHIKMRGNRCWAAQKYGSLDADSWAQDLQKGFNECWRVLEDFGVLIFKWSTDICQRIQLSNTREAASLVTSQIITRSTSANWRSTFLIELCTPRRRRAKNRIKQ